MPLISVTEQSDMIEADGQLSTYGYRRIQNAVLAKAYGDSPTLRRMTESMDDRLRNVSKALTRVAPLIAAARERMQSGTLHDVDLAADLVQAVEGLAALKDKGWSVADELGQGDLTGDRYSPEASMLLQFLSDNIRSPRRIADFVQRYYEAVEAAGDPSQGSMFGDEGPAPTRADLLKTALGRQDGDVAQDPERGIDREGTRPAAQGGRKSEDAARGGRSHQGDGVAAPGAGAGQQGAEADQAAVRAEAVADFKAAMADLVDIAGTHVRAAMIPEKTPELMPTLVRLFDAAIRIVGTDMKVATRWVKSQLKSDPRLKTFWNKIDEALYRKAALQALESRPAGEQAGLFDSPESATDAVQSDLFAPQRPERDAEKVALACRRTLRPARRLLAQTAWWNPETRARSRSSGCTRPTVRRRRTTSNSCATTRRSSAWIPSRSIR